MTDNKKAQEFQSHAQESRTNILQEFWGFLSHNKKWWLTPIILLILFLGLMLVLGGTGAAPFIYSLF